MLFVLILRNGKRRVVYICGMMAKKREKREKIKQKLLHKYRLVILNENTYEEKISFKLSRLNVFVAGTLFALFLIGITTLLIAFTPLREYIPGYSSTALKRKATELTFKTDSLVSVLNYNNQYLESIKKVLKGEISSTEIDKDSLYNQFELDPSEIDLRPSKQDSILREQVAQEDKYSFFQEAPSKVSYVLFSPVTGTISQQYNPKEKHYAIDVVAPKDTPVKAVADGTVIFTGWTTETGYVAIIRHAAGLLSVYKHNGSITKEQGALVKAGEVIATVGNTGELTTGPHLHFELWSEGYPVNPTHYIDFE